MMLSDTKYTNGSYNLYDLIFQCWFIRPAKVKGINQIAKLFDELILLCFLLATKTDILRQYLLER